MKKKSQLDRDPKRINGWICENQIQNVQTVYFIIKTKNQKKIPIKYQKIALINLK